MDVDDTPQAAGEKKRKRAQSSIAAIAPDQEGKYFASPTHSNNLSFHHTIQKEERQMYHTQLQRSPRPSK